MINFPSTLVTRELSGRNTSFLGSQFLSFIMHKMVNRVSIHSRSHSAHIQRAILFVSSTGRQAQSLVVDSTGAGGGGRPLFMLLFARFGTLLFSPSATTFLLPSSCSSSRYLTFFPIPRYLACRESRGNSRLKVHPRTVSREHLLLPRASPK